MQLFANDEQTMLRDSVQRWLAERQPFEVARRLRDSEHGFSREHWREFGELGWLAAGLPEAAGGLGGGAVDHMLLAQCFGAALWNGPWLGSIVMGADLLAASDAEAARALLPALIAGRSILACALHEPHVRHDPGAVRTRARRDADGWCLHGAKSQVEWAAVADALLVSARRDDGTLALFLVPAGTPRLARRDWPSIDGRRLAELTLDGVHVDDDALLAEDALAMIERVCDRAAAALVAEASGAMWMLYETTLAYLGTRRQFGVALGSLQALQHRMVDVYADCEMATSMAWLAAHAAEREAPNERARAVSAAKCRVGHAAARVAQEAVQLHGGMGMTDELPVGHYFKRLTAINTMLGDPAWHARRFRRLAATSETPA